MTRLDRFILMLAGEMVIACARASDTSLAGAGIPTLPPASNRQVEFVSDIKPILEASCIKCHAHGQKKDGFQIDSRDLFIRGGGSGPAAQSGDSGGSLVIQLVAGREPDRVMPAKGARLTPEQIGLLRAWIDQGLAWDEGIKLGRGIQASLAPRRVSLPEGGSSNPIDRLLTPYFAKNNVTPRAAIQDHVFARRAWLDTIGLLPTPEEMRDFARDLQPDKRARLVRRLLADNRRYAEHWMTFWNDALRNDYHGTGYIDGGRKQITPWLYAALATNMPFNTFVAQLVNPNEHSEGFIKGIVWRGVVNASQRPEVQAAQNLSQVFLGINLKCASCHDSFISDWKLRDAYGLASIYASEPLELVRCDKPMGERAQRQFLFPQLGTVVDSTNKTERLASLAKAITSPENGRLARTIVNRLWARFFGCGLVEPVDEMDNPPWNADLLDWLAMDLAEHGYNLKRTMEIILTSEAYQLPSVRGAERPDDKFIFNGPLVRRLSAEEYLDGIGSLTGIGHTLPENIEIDFAITQDPHRNPTPTAKWIWASSGADRAVEPQTIYLRKTAYLTRVPTEAVVIAAADNRFTLFVNGHEAGSGDGWSKPKIIDVRTWLVSGENVFAVVAVNSQSKEGDKSPNPAGFIYQARLRWGGDRRDAASISNVQSAVEMGMLQTGEVPLAPKDSMSLGEFGSDASWLCALQAREGWKTAGFEEEGWRQAIELGDAAMKPWNIEARWLSAWSVAADYGKVRAVLSANDPLMAALGRPNREQVVTARSTVATTLQAFELTNGSTLAGLLDRGARKLIEEAPPTASALILPLYQQALGREPTPVELELAEAAVGWPLHREGVEDLLWAMIMLPEFQLIY